MTGSKSNSKMLHCPALTALKVISGKWKTRILWLLREQPYHFAEIKRTLPGVSAKVLSEQIRQLEKDDIITRREFTRNGTLFVEYSYSEYGRTLVSALDLLGEWGLLHEVKISRTN